MANGKIRDKNHIVEEKSLNFLKNLFPLEWVHHKMEPDYGIDIDLELFDYEGDVCVTLGEHVFLQVKGTESPNYGEIEPIGKQIYTPKELTEKSISVLKFSIDVPLLRLVERMGSTIPVMLVVVDLKEQVPYYICLNDYVSNVLLYQPKDYRNQKSVTIYIPKENILKKEVASWYAKRAKLYGLFQELLTLADNVRFSNADHKVDTVDRCLKTIALSDAWSVCKQWSALTVLKKQIDDMLANNMLSESGRYLLERLVKEDEDPLIKRIYCHGESTPVSALLAAQLDSCDTFLDQAKATSAMFENHVRHMGLPTQVNWMISQR